MGFKKIKAEKLDSRVFAHNGVNKQLRTFQKTDLSSKREEDTSSN